MVVDIGGGTTDIAVISLGGTVVSTSIKVAGDKFDEAIVRYMRKKHSVMIGERTAEELKINIGTVYPRESEVTMDIRGRNLVSGLPKTITVTSSELLEALDEPVSDIIEAVHSVLERTPPELAADISDRGIVMTGGGSLVYGLDKLLSSKTGIDVIIADDAVSCVALGTGKTLDNLDLLKGGNSGENIIYGR
jgi:rod shape-determining protein MreB